MPISTQDLTKLAKSSLDDYLRNTPVDQITQERPFLNMLLKGKKPFGGSANASISIALASGCVGVNQLENTIDLGTL